MIYKKLLENSQKDLDKIAIISGQQHISYSQLRNNNNAFIEKLFLSGIEKGFVVLILIPNSPSFITTTLALFGIGAIAVPTNTNFSLEELQYYCDCSSVTAIIYSDSIEDKVEQLSGDFILIPVQDLEDFAATNINLNARVLPEIESNDPALFMFSSGSTGKPKRITRTHGNIVEEFNGLSNSIELTHEDKIICTVPLYHAHGFGNCLIASLLSGGCIILVEGPFNPRQTLRSIEHNQATIYPAVPFMYQLIAETRFQKMPDLSSIRLLFSAGAALTENTYTRFREVFGLNVYQLYGSTETGAISINYNGPEGTEGSVGLPLSGFCLDILDDSGNIVDQNVTGQIAIKSPAMTAQYDNLTELTENCFIKDYFLSGDLGLKDISGYVYIKGRKKLLINVAGNKVDPLDVESVIQTFPAVAEVVVVGKEHPQYGEIIKAAIVCESECTAEEIISYCQARLTEYKVPKLIEFRDSIPRSPLGKILRKHL